MRVGPAMPEMMVALSHDGTGMTCHLMVLMMAHTLRPKVKATVLLTMLSEITPSQLWLTILMRYEGGHHVLGCYRAFGLL
jgi:hypothetical protein